MGSGMTCVDCHTSPDHKIAGRGVDLRVDEGVPMRACTDCHNPTTEHDATWRRHLDKVACQSLPHPRLCPRRVYRYAARLPYCRGQRPRPVRAHDHPRLNVIPEYAFWNGQAASTPTAIRPSPGS